ncbi:beta-propeller fold lactonase family protein [Rhodopirellula sp. JC639]|uniref:beta-propeller fold lactonase family protein n=1 Tax=Stieleria mannarensis TaxID=2755585 RepID=UPI0015FF8EE7|nr:beta-propeller fold lactonase family protein [Rhodopirellula sp. JC639]
MYLFLAGTMCPAETLVYFGTYTRGDSTSEGIYVAKLDAVNGALPQPRLAAEADNPSYVAIAPGGKFVVVANQKTGNIVSLKIESMTGALSTTESEINVGAPVNVRFIKRSQHASHRRP